MHSRRFWLIAAFVVLVATVLVGYRLLRPAQPHTTQHALTGYVLEVTPEMNRYRVRDAAVLAKIQPGDVIEASD